MLVLSDCCANSGWLEVLLIAISLLFLSDTKALNFPPSRFVLPASRASVLYLFCLKLSRLSEGLKVIRPSSCFRSSDAPGRAPPLSYKWPERALESLSNELGLYAPDLSLPSEGGAFRALGIKVGPWSLILTDLAFASLSCLAGACLCSCASSIGYRSVCPLGGPGPPTLTTGLLCP